LVLAEKILDDIESVQKIDASKMLSLIDALPNSMRQGWTAAESAILPKTGVFKNIVVSGMGGSAISGDIVSTVLRDKAQIPVLVNRNYGCPKYVSSDTLFIAVSYSGNTEETLSSFKKALEIGAKIVSISSGGEIKELSLKNNIPFIEIPKGLPPRAAVGYLLSPILNVIFRLGLYKRMKDDFEETTALLDQMCRSCGMNQKFRENEAKQMAARLHGKLPVILATDGTTAAAALRWKTQLNENSKVTALLSVFPELNHNDIVNFSYLRSGEHNFSVVILRDEDDFGRIKRRIEITKSLISGNVGGIAEIWAKGKSLLARTMSLVLYGDYLSVYLAVLSSVDPTPVDVIDKLKKELLR